jgi:hypothetical protein
MTGKKDDQGKPMFDLLPPYAVEEVARVLTFGAKKYGANSWQNLENSRARYIGAAMRHLFEFAKGHAIDEESGLHHLAHAACSILFVLDHEKRHPQPTFSFSFSGTYAGENGEEPFTETVKMPIEQVSFGKIKDSSSAKKPKPSGIG